MADLEVLLGLSRGDEAALLLAGGEPLDLPGGGDTVLDSPGVPGGCRGGRLVRSNLASLQWPFRGFIISVKSSMPYLTLVFISPGLRPGAVLMSIAW